MEDNQNSIFALKTSAGQERNVAMLLKLKADKAGVAIKSIVVPESLKGYIIVESASKIDMKNPEMRIRHLRGIVGAQKDGTIDMIIPIISLIQKGSVVELVSGPFKGERARVVRLDESREEVVLELVEAAVPIPVTVKADQIRIIKKEAN